MRRQGGGVLELTATETTDIHLSLLVVCCVVQSAYIANSLGQVSMASKPVLRVIWDRGVGPDLWTWGVDER